MNTNINSVSELLTLLKKYRDQFGQSHRGSDFIFRGMSNKTWPLLPGVFREYTEPQKSSTVLGSSYSGRVYTAHEMEMLAHFKKEAGGILPNISQNDEFVWLQYAQHYGIPTRLLDFTTNPLTALYFCCKTESKEDGIVWLINVSSFQRWSHNDDFCNDLGPDFTRDMEISSIMESMKGHNDYDEERLEKYRPIIFVPAYIDQRMSAQASRFLLWGKNENPLEDMIAENNMMKLLPDGIRYNIAGDQRFLAKIIISGESKHHIMRELDLLGVNEKTMFPGLDGIGHYLGRYYKQNADDICEFL